HTYVRQAARAPFMVGMHWFMWSDYAQAAPPGGYPYPPDVNVGLVTADETTVYEELGRWIMRTNAEGEARHRGSHVVSRAEPGPGAGTGGGGGGGGGHAEGRPAGWAIQAAYTARGWSLTGQRASRQCRDPPRADRRSSETRLPQD